MLHIVKYCLKILDGFRYHSELTMLKLILANEGENSRIAHIHWIHGKSGKVLEKGTYIFAEHWLCQKCDRQWITINGKIPKEIKNARTTWLLWRGNICMRSRNNIGHGADYLNKGECVRLRIVALYLTYEVSATGWKNEVRAENIVTQIWTRHRTTGRGVREKFQKAKVAERRGKLA